MQQPMHGGSLKVGHMAHFFCDALEAGDLLLLQVLLQAELGPELSGLRCSSMAKCGCQNPAITRPSR